MAKRKVKTAGGKKAAGKRTRATKAGKKRAPAKKRQAARSARAKKTKSARPKKAKKAAAKKAKSRTSKKAKTETETAKKVKRAAAASSGQRSGNKPKKARKAAAPAKTAQSKPNRSAARSAEKRTPGSAPGSPPSTLPELPAEDDPPRPLPKTRLSDEQLEAFRDMLLAKRAELVGDVDHLTNEALHRSRSEAAGDLSSMPIHMADIGSDNWEQEFTLGLIDNERALLAEIDEALERITAGTYGVCLGTRKPISITRLRAKPWAKYGIEYARLRDQGRVPR